VATAVGPRASTATRMGIVRAETSSRYLPALDGLRAFAVLAVMLYHGDVTWARGGFLGVDVFFVLSGFLITSLLLTEYQRWNGIDLFAFWVRRARRLLPALFVMLLFVAVYTAILVIPESRRDIADQGIATLAYVSNWWEILNDQSYFAQFIAPSPLNHTWSLAIEEQYYLLFPVLIAGWLSLRGGRLRYLPTVLAFGTLASAWWMAAMFTPGQDPSRVYFGTGTRMQDLFVGATLAAGLAVGRRAGRGWTSGTNSRLLSSAPIAAMVLMVVIMFTTDDHASWLYQGGFLLFCLLCGVVVFGTAHLPTSWVTRVLSNRSLVAIGVISYGLYLWHWPIFVWLTPERTELSGISLLAVRFAVTFVVALISYRFIEEPVRSRAVNRRIGGRKEAYGFGIAAGSVTMVFVLLASTSPASLFDSNGSGAPTGSGGGAAGSLSAFLVGDSVTYGLRKEYPGAPTTGLVIDGSTRLGCGVIPSKNFVAGKDDLPAVGCEQWVEQWPAQIAAAKPGLAVLFLGHWQQFDVDDDGQLLVFGTPRFEEWLDGWLDKFTTSMRSASKHLAIVNVPCHRTYDDGVNPRPAITNDDRRTRWLNDAISRYAASHQGIAVVDFFGWLCAPGRNPELIDGVKMRVDGVHFTVQGSHLVWNWLGPQLIDAARQTGWRPAA